MNPVIVLLIIIAAFAVIALTAFFIYRLLHPKLKADVAKPSEEQTLQENLDRVLEPVEDEKLAEQISEYRDEQDQ